MIECVSDQEETRKILGREFIRVFEQAARDVVGSHDVAGDHPVEFLVQGSLYPDVVESGGGVAGSWGKPTRVGRLISYVYPGSDDPVLGNQI